MAAVLDLGAAEGSGDRETLFARVIDRLPEVRERLRDATRVSPVVAVGPFAHWTARATGDRTLLVGDAADFYDPFTGEGIYAALRGAELAAPRVAAALAADATDRRDLRAYDRDRRRAFGTKWLLERAIGLAVATPGLFDRLVRRLARRPPLADLLVSATGDAVPRRAVLSPVFLARLMR